MVLFICRVSIPTIDSASLLLGCCMRGTWSFLLSQRAKHSSVKLLHMLSAFLRACLSAAPDVLPPNTDCVVETKPGWPTPPSSEAIARASDAVDSSALKTSGPRTGFTCASAECNRGCRVAGDTGTAASFGEMLYPRARCLGDVDMVVTVVVAVPGRAVACDMAAPDDVGSLPVISNLRIRDFRSSSSSHTVDGAVVEVVDSLSVLRLGSSGESLS
jgi:hypothetical protein